MVQNLPLTIGNYNITPPLVLAPMAGITNRPFRDLCAQDGCLGLSFCPMISANGLMYNSSRSKTYKLLDWREEDLNQQDSKNYETEIDNNNNDTLNKGCNFNNKKPIAVQIFGSDAETIAKSAKIISDLGADIIDLNFGCQVPKILKLGCGSALLKDPDLCLRIIESTIKAVSIPVTCKMRLCFTEDELNKKDFAALYIAKRAENLGLKGIFLHGRTAESHFSGIVNYQAIGKIVEHSGSIPVIGNGDIDSFEKAQEMFSKTGCQGIMIGRASLGKPWIFKDIAQYLKFENNNMPLDPNKEDITFTNEEMRIKSYLLKHIELISQFTKDELSSVRQFRTHLNAYPISPKLKSEMLNKESLSDLKDILLKENHLRCNKKIGESY